MQRYDSQLKASWRELADRSFDETACKLLGLPAKQGGIGAQYANDRRWAAYFSSWTAAAETVTEDLHCSTMADALDKLPSITSKLEEARQGLLAQGIRFPSEVTLANSLARPSPQGLLMACVQKNTRAAVMQSLPQHQQAEVRGAGGPGSTGFVAFPSELACGVEDADWAVAVRKRLRLRRAECADSELAMAKDTCQLKTADGVVCGQPLDDQGYHACTCQSGGGVVRRHGRVIKGVGSLVARWKSVAPLEEQRVPAWDRPSRSRQPGRDPIERAILDLEYEEDDGRMWIDVSIRHPAAGNASELATAAKRDGEASR